MYFETDDLDVFASMIEKAVKSSLQFNSGTYDSVFRITYTGGY